MSISHELIKVLAQCPIGVCMASFSASLQAASRFDRESGHGQ